jgi:glutathione S-transferase
LTIARAATILRGPEALRKEPPMSLTFYYAPMTTAGITEDVLAELGTPCERVKLDLRAGDTKKPEFLAVNPNGRVPTIVHDGTAIWESAAITMYLGETFGVDAKIYPAPGPKRGEAMKWIVWANVTLAEAATRLMMHTAEWVPEAQRSASAAEAARTDVAARLGILDHALTGKAYLLGDYTLADTHLQAVVHWITMLKVDMAALGNVRAWLVRCSARPALAKAHAAATAG